MNQYQRAYKNCMTQVRENDFYLAEYINSSSKINTMIEGFTAFVSSTSIATWAIWKEYEMLWAGLIAISQVINAIKHLLPFKNRLNTLYPLRIDLGALALDLEKNWYEVSEGKLTEKEISDLTNSFRKKLDSLNKEYFSKEHLPEKEKFIEKAKNKTKVFYENLFPALETYSNDEGSTDAEAKKRR